MPHSDTDIWPISGAMYGLYYHQFTPWLKEQQVVMLKLETYKRLPNTPHETTFAPLPLY